MLEQIWRALIDVIRNLLDEMSGKSAQDDAKRTEAPSPAEQDEGRSVAIMEVASGNGPAWGTLSSLVAHGRDPSRLYAVTDQDSPPLRIIEIEVTRQTARAVGKIWDLFFRSDRDPIRRT